jgi:hypothetical protein
MTAAAKYNNQYKVSALTNQKYLPLADVLCIEDKAIYNKLLLSRLTQLIQRRMVTQLLEFTTSVPRATVIANEVGHLPPLVVVSAGRSAWLQDSLTTARDAATPDYGNVSNLEALTEAPEASELPVLYSSKRRGPNRNAYVVVHSSEFAAYRQATAGMNITVVGWQFRKAPGINEAITGFGASRYAAVEFCKLLRRATAAPRWNYAWLLDDNVVALTNFAGFPRVEAAMNPTTVAAGFQAATTIMTRKQVMEVVYKELALGRGNEVDTLPSVNTESGIIQQASLWNIQYLDDNFLNFSPVYATSAEDTSITYYLKMTGKTFLLYPGIEVIKSQATSDGGAVNPLANLRRDFTEMFARHESATIPGEPSPPPVMVDVVGTTPTSSVTMSVFVRTYFGTDPSPDEVASRAMEQITVESIRQNKVDQRVLEQAFRVNQGQQQPTRWQ